ncbi:MAG: methyltransferase family protein [Pseudohongiellaceae bacterium]
MNPIAIQIIKRIFALPILIWLILLLPAGTLDYWEVYAYFGMVLIMMIIAMMYFLKHDPDLLKRRLEHKETESEQKLAVVLLGLSILAIYIVSGLDERFEMSVISLWMQVVGFVLVAVGYIFVNLVMKANSFAARAVKVEQSQQLVDTGLYGIVRHPMYSGVIIMYFGTPIALGSWWGLLPLLLFLVGLQIRMNNEEEVLERELEGYGDYKQRLRWRVIPGIW